MAVAYSSIANTAYGSRTNSSVTKPTGTVSGDTVVIWLVLAKEGTLPTPTAPSGFELVTGPTWPISETISGFNVADRLYWKVAGGSEPTSYAFTHTTANSAVIAIRVTGAGASPSFVISTNSGTGTTATFTGITTTKAESLILAFMQDFGDTANNLTPPTGTTPTFTERLDTVLAYACTGTLASAGATGNKTMTNNNSSGVTPWGTAMLGIAPASEGGKTVEGQANLSGSGSLSSAPTKTTVAKATLAGTGSISAKGTSTRMAQAILPGTGALSAVGNHIGIGHVVLEGHGALSAKGVQTAQGRVVLAGSGALSAKGTAARLGQAVLEGHGGLKATGEAEHKGTTSGQPRKPYGRRYKSHNPPE